MRANWTKNWANVFDSYAQHWDFAQIRFFVGWDSAPTRFPLASRSGQSPNLPPCAKQVRKIAFPVTQVCNLSDSGSYGRLSARPTKPATESRPITEL
jgi:hypothetical protein